MLWTWPQLSHAQVLVARCSILWYSRQEAILLLTAGLELAVSKNIGSWPTDGQTYHITFQHLYAILTLKAPRKIASENVVCLCCLLNILPKAKIAAIFCIPANSVDPDQTAPKGSVWSGSTLFAEMTYKITSRIQSRQQLLSLAL